MIFSKVDGALLPVHPDDIERFAEIGESVEFEVPVDGGKQKTAKQRAALHVYCEQMAEALNDAGFDQKATLALFNGTAKIPWTKESFKEIWKAVQVIMLGKKSTEDLNTVDPSEIYRAVDKMIAEKTGVTVAWPSRRG